MLTHAHESYELFLIYGGFKNVDAADEDFEQPRLLWDETTFRGFRFTPIWEKKIRGILEVTRVPGWHRETYFTFGKRAGVVRQMTGQVVAQCL